MKKSVFVLIAAIAFAAMSFVSAPMWVTHHDALGFKINFPATPTRTVLSSTDPLVLNKIKLEQITTGFPRFTLIYEEKSAAYVNVNKVLNDLVDAHCAKVSGTIVFRSTPRAWKLGTQVTAKIENSAGLKCNIRTFINGSECVIMIVEQNGTYAPFSDVSEKFWETLVL
ncbi:MAG: hypothetical protein CVU11_15465 [Bacteroidetes bacterium HGW-Bacteroidetes-6]|jgi:hypothetical protein|nr:MAG: hypothetical protein CVU11_15465 [Bacteroidetes bacterium HGW-Bacteroidetes-6]